MGTAVQVAPHAVRELSFDRARLEERRKTLGASEIAAVAGFNPHKSPVAVWAEKRGLVAPFEGNEFTEWGLRLEGAIRQKYAEVIGAPVQTSETLVDPANPWRSCTPDGLVTDIPGNPLHGVEVKRFGEYRMDDFGVAGTDHVPLDVASQCFWSMDITGLRRWDVAVLLGQADFRIFTLHWDEEVARSLYDVGHEFWHKYVIPGIEPPLDGSKGAREYLSKRYPTNTDALLPATAEYIELGRQLRGLKTQIDELDRSAQEVEHKLKGAIASAAGIDGVCTWKAPRSGPVSWKAIAEALGAQQRPDLITANTGEPSRRFLLTLKS